MSKRWLWLIIVVLAAGGIMGWLIWSGRLGVWEVGLIAFIIGVGIALLFLLDYKERQMNTLRDTEEGRARPSVWPVYVAAGVVGLASLYISTWAAGSFMRYPALVEDIVGGQLERLYQVIGGPLGLLSAYGLARLRRWGWVCGWLWVPISAVLWVMRGWEEGCDAAMSRIQGLPAQTHIGWAVFAWVWLVAIVLLMCALVARRPLFFPPKPEAAE